MPSRLESPTPRLDPHTLEIFVHVCESGSMTSAAQRMGLSQPAVSLAIKQLERGFGVDLLDRQSRPLLLTPAGEVLRARATRLLADAQEARAAVLAAAEAALPCLRLGLVDSFAVTVGPGLIHRLQRHAHEVRVWSGLSRQLASGLLARELDVLVSAESMDDVADLEVHTLYREPFLLALPRRCAVGHPEDLSDLAATLPLVRYSLRSTTGQQVERYLKRMRVDAPRRLEFDGSESVVAMVQEGLGWAVTTPLCLLQGRVDFERLRLLPLPGHAPCRALFVIARTGEATEPAARIFRWARGLMKPLLRDLCRHHLPFAQADISFE